VKRKHCCIASSRRAQPHRDEPAAGTETFVHVRAVRPGATAATPVCARRSTCRDRPRGQHQDRRHQRQSRAPPRHTLKPAPSRITNPTLDPILGRSLNPALVRTLNPTILVPPPAHIERRRRQRFAIANPILSPTILEPIPTHVRSRTLNPIPGPTEDIILNRIGSPLAHLIRGLTQDGRRLARVDGAQQRWGACPPAPSPFLANSRQRTGSCQRVIELRDLQTCSGMSAECSGVQQLWQPHAGVWRSHRA